MAFDLAESGVDEGRVLEALPDEVVASLEVRDAWRRQMASESPALEFLVSHVQPVIGLRFRRGHGGVPSLA
jgi:hypothetical protein